MWRSGWGFWAVPDVALGMVQTPALSRVSCRDVEALGEFSMEGPFVSSPRRCLRGGAGSRGFGFGFWNMGSVPGKALRVTEARSSWPEPEKGLLQTFIVGDGDTSRCCLRGALPCVPAS